MRVRGGATIKIEREIMKKSRWLTVEITDEIIRKAKPDDCYECLIALALVKATGFIWHVWKDSARIETICGPLGKLRRTWKLPDSLQALMRAFDRGDEVQPTSFKLPARFADKDWLRYGAGVEL